MRYYVEWWYTSADRWMNPYKHFWFKRSACRYIGKRVVQGHRSASKWRVVDGKTNKVIMTVERTNDRDERHFLPTSMVVNELT